MSMASDSQKALMTGQAQEKVLFWSVACLGHNNHRGTCSAGAGESLQASFG